MTQQPADSQNDLQAAREAAAGAALFAQHRYHESLSHYLQAARLRPNDADLQFNVASAATAINDLGLARQHLLRAVELNPSHALAHDALARSYQLANDVNGALRHSEIAVRLESANLEFILTRAAALESARRWQEAAELVEPLIANPSVRERAAALFVDLAPQLGRQEQAVQIIERFANAPVGAAPDRRGLHFAATGLFDRMKRYDEAFEHATRAHQINPRPYDRIQYDRAFESRIGCATRSKLTMCSHATRTNRRPVFIVGMPRSGTSLVEQILACHPQVYAAGELDALSRTAALLDSRGVAYPKSLDVLSPEGANALAGHYISAIESLNASATYLTDKMPLNFIYLDLVELLFPEAHVIHCTRDPLDTCLSCYMTDFAIPQAFAESLPNLGHFYRNYQRIMSHWREHLSVPMLELRYEDVVQDLESQTRRVLDFLGLPWDERCLRFHENARPVATASRDQVRTPLYATSVGRWKQYEQHLKPLADMLRLEK